MHGLERIIKENQEAQEAYDDLNGFKTQVNVVGTGPTKEDAITDLLHQFYTIDEIIKFEGKHGFCDFVTVERCHIDAGD